jgi:hypothetical protein
LDHDHLAVADLHLEAWTTLHLERLAHRPAQDLVDHGVVGALPDLGHPVVEP